MALLASAFPLSAPASDVPLDDRVEIVMREDRREVDPVLLAYTQHASAAIRARAALAIGRIGRPEDVPVLAALLRDEEVGVRRAAVFALGEIADSTSADPIAAHLTGGEEPDETTRALAADALGKLGRGGVASGVALEDPAAVVRERALLAAWRMPVPGAFEHALAALEDPDPEVRWAGAYCLMRLLGAPPSGRTAIPSVEELTDADRARGRDALLGALASPDARVRLQALRGLRRVGNAEVTRALEAARRDADWRVRVEAVRALASEVTVDSTRVPRDVGFEALTPFLDDSEENVRVTAVEALATVGAEEAVFPYLRERLIAGRPRVREVAFSSLITRWSAADTPDVELIESTCNEVLGDAQWTLRALAPDAVDLVPDARALPLLRRLVDDPDGRVGKLAVAPYLTHTSAASPESLWVRLAPVVSRLMGAEDVMVRVMTVATLGELFEADSMRTPTDDDWGDLEAFLERTYSASTAGTALVDLRQAIVGVAAAHADRPALARMLEAACHDPSYLVRRDAVQAIEARDETPPRRAEPVETGRDAAAYRAILEWAAADHWAVIETDAGRIVLTLHAADAPLTCWNFATLANDGFYDDTSWHRVVPNFVLQDGCPRGDGWGGPDWQIRCEINRHRYERGALGMALSGKDTGGSQFFITHAAQPHLDGGYTVFGQVVHGMGVADDVVQGDGIRTVRVVEEAPAAVGDGR